MVFKLVAIVSKNFEKITILVSMKLVSSYGPTVFSHYRFRVWYYIARFQHLVPRKMRLNSTSLVISKVL
jgi:hypothetical protein